MKIALTILIISFISGCGVARQQEEWDRERETFRQLDEAYKSGKITEREYFDLKARLMTKERSVNVQSSGYRPAPQPFVAPGAAQLRKHNPYLP